MLTELDSERYFVRDIINTAIIDSTHSIESTSLVVESREVVEMWKEEADRRDAENTRWDELLTTKGLTSPFLTLQNTGPIREKETLPKHPSR